MDLKTATQVFNRRINYVSDQVSSKRGSELALNRAQNEANAGNVIMPIINTFLDWQGGTKIIEIDGKKFKITEEISSFSSFKEAMEATLSGK